MSTPVAAAWVAVSLVTFLGDPLVIASLGLGVYWFGDRLPAIGARLDPRRRSLLFASIAGALALAAALKTLLAVDRLAGAADLPGVVGMPETLVPLYTWVVGPGGYAFPSGHAAAATVGWLGLAWALGNEDRRPVALAGGLVVAVAVSRVALGVHRPIEVLAGVAVGLGYLLVTFVLLGRPRRAFVLAGLIGAISPIAIGVTGDSLLVAAVALGTAVGWLLIDEHGHGSVLPAVAGVVASIVVGVVVVRSGVPDAALAVVGLVGGGVAIAGRWWIHGVENG